MTASVVELHARWCSGGCPRWLAADAPGCLPYPCRCAQHKADAPDWLREKARREGVEIRCWWRKRTGAIASRCPCWGTDRDGRPGDCCAHHSANPRYAAVVVGTPDPDAAPFEIPTEPADWHAPHERAERTSEPDPELDWPDEYRVPYVRRWDPAELTCPCVLPYADDKRSATVHCVTCCQDFANHGTMHIHRPLWTGPCRDPWKIRDVDTGRALLYQDGAGIWHDSYPGADDGVHRIAA